MIYIILFSILQITVAKQLCLNCRDVVDPGACSTVTQCGDHEECFMSQSISPDGLIFYDLGCRDKVLCGAYSGRRSLTEYDTRSGNLNTCYKCCNGSALCNLGGMCGVKQLDLRNGTLCFACHQMIQPGNCGSVTLCSSDKVCYLGQKIVGLSGIKVYEARCADPRTECPFGVKSGSGVVFGKRNIQLEHSNKRWSDSYCKECCSGHMCNNYCPLSKVL